MTQTASKVVTMKYVLLTLAVILAFAGICYSAGSQPGKDVLLQDRHKTEGVSCVDCHQENPPAKQIPMARCVECHGDYKKMAHLTQKIEPNPHEHHEGTLDCNRCHHVHKKSVDFCLECHSWGYVVP